MAEKTGRTLANMKPLSGSVYYLDIRPSRRRELLKLDLLKLGAQLEEFLSKDVKYLVTDRLDGTIPNAINHDYNSKIHLDGDSWLPETPVSGIPSPTFTRVCPLDNDIQFPDSPLTDSQKIPVPIHPAVQSRGQALLERAVKHKKIQQKKGSADVLEVSRQFGIKILPLRTFLQSIDHLLETYKQKASLVKVSLSNKKTNDKPSYKLVTLGEHFIKVQDLKEEHRPFYRKMENFKLFWEQFANENQDESKPLKENKLMSPKTPSAPSQREGSSIGLAAKVRDMYKVKKRDKQELKRLPQPKLKAGYCEICSTSFSNLAKHMSTEKHSAYMCNKANFEHLKEMVRILPSIGSLKKKKRKRRPHTELKEDNKASQQKKKTQAIQSTALCTHRFNRQFASPLGHQNLHHQNERTLRRTPLLGQ